jgi:hypothetical protein
MSENRQNPTGQPAEADIGVLMALLERDLEDMAGRIVENISGE